MKDRVTISIELERKAFEKAMRSENFMMSEHDLQWEPARNCYTQYYMHFAWRCWQARAEQSIAAAEGEKEPDSTLKHSLQAGLKKSVVFIDDAEGCKCGLESAACGLFDPMKHSHGLVLCFLCAHPEECHGAREAS